MPFPIIQGDADMGGGYPGSEEALTVIERDR